MFRWNKIFTKELIIHPLNIVLLFIVNTSAQKIKAGLPVGFVEPVVSFLIILIFSLVIFFIINLFFKDRFKTSLMMSFILLVILFFGDIVELVTYFEVAKKLRDVSIPVGKLFLTIILSLFLLGGLTVWLRKLNRSPIKMNSYLNILTAIFLIIEIFDFSFPDIYKINLKEKIELKIHSNDKTKVPDIYFILLDGYTGFPGLERLCNYENNDFKKFLTSNDFFIAENAKAIYHRTIYSMVSIFNMSEIIYNIDDIDSKASFLSLADHIKNNSVVNFFNEKGYKFVNFSFWDIFDTKKYYKDIFYFRRGNIYEARTMYGHLYEIYNENFADLAETNLNIFKQLTELKNFSESKPKFVYAHITMPHYPFYFDAEGKKMDLTYALDRKDKNKYLEQLKYTNKLLMKTINDILNSAKEPPVIIIQSDHGFRAYTGKGKEEIKYSALSCFYFPDKDYSLLNDSLKTTNIFKVIFNKYFNQDLKLVN